MLSYSAGSSCACQIAYVVDDVQEMVYVPPTGVPVPWASTRLMSLGRSPALLSTCSKRPDSEGSLGTNIGVQLSFW
jgi:hypothetical protein